MIFSNKTIRIVLMLIALSAFVQNGYAARFLDIQIKITNYWRRTIKVTGKIYWGSWYKDDDKGSSAPDPSALIRRGHHIYVKACGALFSASGTEGTLYAYDLRNNQKLGTFYFNVPFQGRNEIRLSFSSGFGPATSASTSKWGANGAIGAIDWNIFVH